MEKIIVIPSCKKCPYFESDYFCKKEKKDLPAMLCGEIPSWCPLADMSSVFCVCTC